MGKTVSFNRPDGKSVNGYLAEAPTASKAPALVVIQEWWGLNDQICGVADRFARAGYNALAPDLYKGRLTSVPDEAPCTTPWGPKRTSSTSGVSATIVMTTSLS